jgi:SP family sugar porter-like MFS transporter
MKGKREKAWSVLSRIGGNRYAERELQMVEQTSASKSEGGLKLLFSRPFRKVLVLGVIVAVFQQWCGTNVIFNYAQEIFQSAGYSLGDVLFNIVVTGVANVIFTFVAIYTVERLGRRALMLLGAGGLAGIYLVLGACYFFQVSGFFMVVLVVLAIACYAMSLGPITWVLLAEIFPNRVRGVAMATCTFALWVGSFTLTYTFPLLNTALGSYGTFWIYSAICVSASLHYFTEYIQIHFLRETNDVQRTLNCAAHRIDITERICGRYLSKRIRIINHRRKKIKRLDYRRVI